MHVTDDYSRVLIHRIVSRVLLRELHNLGIRDFYVGGNSLNRASPNDIDIYPTSPTSFYGLDANRDSLRLLARTKNATTINLNGSIVQFCNYQKDSLKDLVESFDYAHIQVGARICDMQVIEVYFTEGWVNSHVLESTWFVGSEYPLSSLIRAFKYHERGNFAGKSYIPSVLDTLCAVIERGFSSYQDFKDQLDAVDLGLLPEELSEVERGPLLRLYTLLTTAENPEDR
jgi:hypothetical protein